MYPQMVPLTQQYRVILKIRSFKDSGTCREQSTNWKKYFKLIRAEMKVECVLVDRSALGIGRSQNTSLVLTLPSKAPDPYLAGPIQVEKHQLAVGSPGLPVGIVVAESHQAVILSSGVCCLLYKIPPIPNTEAIVRCVFPVISNPLFLS